MPDATDRDIVVVRQLEHPADVEHVDLRDTDDAVHTHSGMPWTGARALSERTGLDHRDEHGPSTPGINESTLTRTSPVPGRNGSATSSGSRPETGTEGRCTPGPRHPPGPMYSVPQRPPVPGRRPPKRRRLARRLAAAALVVVWIGLVTTGCPPPTTPRFQPCENVTAAPFRCSIQHRVDSAARVTTFVAAASTSEPQTGIKMHVILEQKVSDPTDSRGYRYVQQWQDYSTSAGASQAWQWGGGGNQDAPWMGCLPGIYRWHLEVIFFSAQNTTWTSNSADFVV